MKKPLLYLCIGLFWFFQGCTRSPALPEVTQTRTLVPPPLEVSSTKTPVITNTSTAPSIRTPVPTSTNPPTATFTPTLANQLVCNPLHTATHAEKTDSGKIILVGDFIHPNDSPDNDSHGYYESFIYDLSSGKISALPPEKIMDVAVSPDRTRYAIKDAADDLIKVFTAQGKLLATINRGEPPYHFFDRWLDNRRIALAIMQPIEGTTYWNYPADIVVIDIFTGKEKRLVPDLPEIDQANARMHWEGSSTTKYDSTLSRVVYPGVVLADNPRYNKNGYILWDMVNKEKLAQIASINFGATPKWSPDDSKLVVNLHEDDGEFYVITREGEISKISNLNGEGKDGSPPERIFYSVKYDWSPDGRYLAFWRETDRSGEHEANLAVLDMETGEVVDFCLPAGKIGYMFLSYFKLVWSPDGKALVTIANVDEEGNFDTILVDLEERIAVKIGENLTPQGWLDDSQK